MDKWGRFPTTFCLIDECLGEGESDGGNVIELVTHDPDRIEMLLKQFNSIK